MVNWPAVAVNVPVFEPAAIVREAGTVMLPVDPSVTAAPPDPAAALSVTVQVVSAPGPRAVGLQVVEVIVGRAVATTMEPPLPVIVTALPAGSEPNELLTAMVVVPETVAERLATMPLPIAVVFMPLAMQLYPPARGEHVNVLPAAVSAGPAVIDIFVAVEGYVRVHCSAEILTPAVERERATDPAPAEAILEERVRDDWPRAVHDGTRRPNAAAASLNSRKFRMNGSGGMTLPDGLVKVVHLLGYAGGAAIGSKPSVNLWERKITLESCKKG